MSQCCCSAKSEELDRKKSHFDDVFRKRILKVDVNEISIFVFKR